MRKLGVAWVAGLMSLSIGVTAAAPVTFQNDTKGAAGGHVLRAPKPVSCTGDRLTAGRASDVLKAGDEWTADHGDGCWAWSPGSDNFDDQRVKRWCVMAPGGKYRLSAKEHQSCRVDD